MKLKKKILLKNTGMKQKKIYFRKNGMERNKKNVFL